MRGRNQGGRAVGAGADAAIGHGEDAVGAGDGEVAGEHEAQPESAGGTVDPGDDRLRHPPHDADDPMNPVDHRLEVLPAFLRRPLEQAVKGAQVAARHEIAAGTLQHDHARLGLALDVRKRGVQSLAKLVVERVQHVRPVEGYPGDAVRPLDQHRVAHGPCLHLPPPSRAGVLPSRGVVGETAV